MDNQIQYAFASLVGCSVLQWPLTYLDIPLGGNSRALSFWDPVVRKISKKLDCWKGAFFSLGGRITLIQLCLSSIPSYFLPLSNSCGCGSRYRKTHEGFPLVRGWGFKKRPPC